MDVTLRSLRGSLAAFALAVVAWSTGCATAPPPLVDAAFATGQYAPARIAVLPPDVFVVLDQAGDNDPVQSAALGQAVSEQTVRAVDQALRARGYDVDLSARWDGIVGPDGSLLVNRDELGWLANGVLQFGNMRAGENAPPGSPYVAPELAAKVGWATQSDALLYVNVKGVATTSGKRAASVIAAVFIVVIVAAIVVMVALNAKGGGGGPGNGGGSGGWKGGGNASSVPRSGSVSGFRGGAPVAGGHAAAMPSGGGFHGAPTGGAPSGGAAAAMPSGGFHGTPGGAAGGMPSGNAMAHPGGAAAGMPSGNTAAGGMGNMAHPGGAAAGMPSGTAARSAPTGAWSGAPAGGAAPPAGGWRTGGAASGMPSSGAPTGGWRGGGAAPPPPPGAYTYGGGPRVGFGVGVVIPLDGPMYTHDGDVQHEDEIFAGDELYVSMTLVSTSDGRVLWHARQELDLDADDPADVDRMVQSFVGSLPPRGGFPPAPPPKH